MVARSLVFALACGLGLAGCFESHVPEGGPDRCDAVRTCFAVDAVGCCGDRTMNISVCELCPPGMAEEASCRSAGCEVEVCDAPLRCRRDVGGGCCDADVVNESCDSCPPGSMRADRCTGDFPECACDEVRPIVPPVCLPDLGNGCCQGPEEAGVEMGPCGCPDGTTLNWECEGIDYGNGDTDSECFEDEGGGCCGAPVATACGQCPEGSLPAAECPAFGGGPPEEEDAPGAPAPPDLADCRVDLGDGVCGCPVASNSCGLCPNDATRDCRFVNCLMP